MEIIWCLLLMLLAREAKGWKMHNIYWNTTNPMFRIDNTDNVIDINMKNLNWEYDQANIICPRYRTGTREADIEKYVIYNVSKEEYEDCRIVQPQPRVIAVCDKPHDLKYVTITFRSFTPTPGGLEFRPGTDYYFISTSSRGDLYRRLGGRCSTHNMRLVFKVAQDKDQENKVNSASSAEIELRTNVNVPRVEEGPHGLSGSGSGPKVLPELTQLSDFHSYLYPMRDIIELDSNSVEHEKRSENYANHPNEVVKQASVMHSKGLRQATGSLLLILLSLYALASLR